MISNYLHTKNVLYVGMGNARNERLGVGSGTDSKFSRF